MKHELEAGVEYGFWLGCHVLKKQKVTEHEVYNTNRASDVYM